MMIEDKKITITNENGETQEGEILFTIEINGDNFVTYTINETIYAAKINPDDSLMPVEEDEWKLLEKVIEEYLDENEESDDNQ